MGFVCGYMGISGNLHGIVLFCARCCLYSLCSFCIMNVKRGNESVFVQCKCVH